MVKVKVMHIFIWKISKKVKVKVMHISIWNISKMVTDTANFTIVIKYDAACLLSICIFRADVDRL